MRTGPSVVVTACRCGSLSPANRSFCSNIIALHKNLLVVLQWVYELCVGHQSAVGPDLSRPPPMYRPVGNPPPTRIILLKLILGLFRFLGNALGCLLPRPDVV